MSIQNKKYYTVSFVTLGCKVNQFETEAMSELLEKEGFKIVQSDEDSDIYIINTCAVTKESERKSRQFINKAKRKNKNAIVAAVGCSVQLNGEEIKKETSADIIIGTKNKGDIAKILIRKIKNFNNINCKNIEVNEKSKKKKIDTNKKYINIKIDKKENKYDKTKIDANKYRFSSENKVIEGFRGKEEFEELKISSVHEKTRANIKIQDGCNRYCSYCIIPYVRGPIRSRKHVDIINEIKNIADNGYKEVVLNGIHISSYGIERNEENALINLIESINSIEKIERIRLGSLEPRLITEDFIKRYVSLQKVCDHFHLSLQSGSNGVLRRMNRKYLAEEYKEKVQIIRKYMPNAGITTDIIVGFPGETIEEFQETVNFVKDINFSRIHVFKYSVREGTKAAEMDNQIPENIKSLRSKELINLGDQLEDEFMKKFIGNKISVLFETEDNNLYEGYTSNYLKALVTCNDNIKNKMIEVRVIDIKNDCLLCDVE